MSQPNKHKLNHTEDELGLVDIIQFLNHNSKFLGLTTLLLSAIAIALYLLSPKPYQKQLTLSVQSTPVPLSVQSFPKPSLLVLEANQMDALAVEFLSNLQLDQITAKPQYSVLTRKIDLNLQSPDAKLLTTADSQIVSQLKSRFQKHLSQTLTTSLTATELQLKKLNKTLPQLEQQIAQLPSTKTAELEALEIERAKSVSAIAALRFDRDYLKQSQKNLANFTAQVISVQILSESEVQPTRSSGQLVILAVLASFMVAVLAAIIRNQIPRLKNELSQRKIDRNTGV